MEIFFIPEIPATFSFSKRYDLWVYTHNFSDFIFFFREILFLLVYGIGLVFVFSTKVKTNDYEKILLRFIYFTVLL